MKKSKWTNVIINAQIDELFEVINKLENLSSGDITPTQDERLEEIKESLAVLLNEYTDQNRQKIKEFINKYCTLVSDTDDNDTELYMDNHKCIVYDNKQYYLPEDISFGGRDAEIYDLLIDDYQYG